MPQQQILPTWLAWNNCNFPTQSGIQDSRTGQDFPAGGLNLGDYFDCTEQEANGASASNIGLLHSGRYRLVQVDSGATATNVKTGTVGYLRPGLAVQGVRITTAGTGATAGTYNIAATVGSGGGSGAVIQVSVSGGAITSATVVQGGTGYTSVPSFSLTTTNTTGGVVAAQLSSNPNRVTSFDQASLFSTLVRPVVFLNSITPGNYGFIQELGLATVLAQTSALTSATANAWVDAVTLGVVNTRASSNGPTGVTIGQAIDLPIAAQLFKIYLTQGGIYQN
jgi:hypothetical protein